MIQDCEDGKIDTILTKEVSRFARNTVDTLTYTRRLSQLGVNVIFMNDGIDTNDKDGELRLSIMSSIAQEESRKTSDRIKLGLKRRMEKGDVIGCRTPRPSSHRSRSRPQRVIGFGRSVSRKAVHGNKNYLAKQLDKSIINGTIDSKKYDDMLKKRQIVDVTTLDPKHRSLPIKCKPGSIVDLVENGTVMQRRIFGYDGKAIVDFDTNDHYKPKFHKTGAHKHTFDYFKNNPRSSAKNNRL